MSSSSNESERLKMSASTSHSQPESHETKASTTPSRPECYDTEGHSPHSQAGNQEIEASTPHLHLESHETQASTPDSCPKCHQTHAKTPHPKCSATTTLSQPEQRGPVIRDYSYVNVTCSRLTLQQTLELARIPITMYPDIRDQHHEPGPRQRLDPRGPGYDLMHLDPIFAPQDPRLRKDKQFRRTMELLMAQPLNRQIHDETIKRVWEQAEKAAAYWRQSFSKN